MSENTETLKLPGRRGLIQTCSPAFINEPKHHLHGRRCVVVEVDGDLVRVAVEGVESCLLVPLENLDLDLTDKTGRAHAAWWLWGQMHDQVDPVVPCTAPEWLACPDVWSLGASFVPASGEVAFATFGAVEDADPAADEVVHALADLDPNDPRTLPDGSRWVDAEALRLVCLHVAGMGAP